MKRTAYVVAPHRLRADPRALPNRRCAPCCRTPAFGVGGLL